MVLLIAVAQEPQVFLGADEVVVDTAADPIIVGMRGDAVLHNLGDYFKCFGE